MSFLLRTLIAGTIGMLTRKGDQQDPRARESWKEVNERRDQDREAKDRELPPGTGYSPRRGPGQHPEP